MTSVQKYGEKREGFQDLMGRGHEWPWHFMKNGFAEIDHKLGKKRKKNILLTQGRIS